MNTNETTSATAATLTLPTTPLERRRLTRRCSHIADMVRDCEHYVPDTALYQLARAAVHLRDYPSILRAVQLWEEIPAAKRAKIEAHAERWRKVAQREQRIAWADKAPSLREPWDDDRDAAEARTRHRFAALHIVAYYGIGATSPLFRAVRAAILDGYFKRDRTLSRYGPPLILWDTMTPQERQAILERTEERLPLFESHTGQAVDRWWIDALALPAPVPDTPDDGISDAEAARLRKRFAAMSREEHAAD